MAWGAEKTGQITIDGMAGKDGLTEAAREVEARTSRSQDRSGQIKAVVTELLKVLERKSPSADRLVAKAKESHMSPLEIINAGIEQIALGKAGLAIAERNLDDLALRVEGQETLFDTD